MLVPPTQILLVTPVWNDSARLADFGQSLALALAASRLPIRWVIADDGSPAVEQARLVQLTATLVAIYPWVEIHFATAHRGKGSIVREAWTLAPAAEWLVFVDADGSLTADGLLELIACAMAAGTSVMGIRKRTATTTVVASPWRGLVHRGFLLATHLLLDLHCEDPQCGAKVLLGADYRQVASELMENGLAFDSELLAALRRAGASWLEMPVNWNEKTGGQVRPFRDAWGMIAALWRIRRHRS